MVYNQLKYRYFIVAFLLGFDSIFFAFSLINRWWYSTAFFSLLWAVLLFYIFYLQQNTNRLITNFLNSLKFEDYNIDFSSGTSDNREMQILKSSFTRIATNLKELNREREKNYFYVQNIIEHIDIGIIAFNMEGRIILINKALLNLFGIKRIEDIAGFESVNSTIMEEFIAIKPLEQKLVKLTIKQSSFTVSIYATRFSVDDEIVKLVSLKNIKQELEHQELDSWQKLIRVLTHEIMNSIAPISSLSQTVNYLLSDAEEKEDMVEIDKENFTDTKQALKTIHSRSEGLLHFVETFRSLTKIPKPELKIFSISNLFENVYQIFKSNFSTYNIRYEKNIQPENLELLADISLLEQVLINLIKNAVEILKNQDNAIIKLGAGINRFGQTEIKVEDNGQGILPEVLEKIFIPFFTTKQSGNGIGLSLSRQIVNMHGGSLAVFSKKGQTIFTITI